VQAVDGPHGVHILFALEGAIQNIDGKALPALRRNELLRFAATHLERFPAT
jgi:hypothetical protein